VSEPPRPTLVIPASGASSLPRLPAYVEHGGEIACRHPADALGSRMYGFVIPARRDRLDAYCDRCFNNPTGGEEQWRAVSDQVLLNFVDIPTMGSTDEEDEKLGMTHEREAAIWFPVYEPRRNLVAWAIPYMFVDSGLAMAGGREVYGFPKQLGRLNIPVGDSSPPMLTLNTVTFAKYGPASQVRDHRVVTVERPGAPVDLASEGSDAAHALDTVIEALGAVVERRLVTGDVLGWLKDLFRDGTHYLYDVFPHVLFFRDLVEEHAPMLLLKQFRDAHVPGAACYQALVYVDMQVLEFRAGGLLPENYRVTIGPLEGEPISRELGVAGASMPSMAFWLDFDFLVKLGEVLWEAPVG
jgi:acetoacetate decarboxylase